MPSENIDAIKLDEQNFYKKHTADFFKIHDVKDLSWEQFFSSYLHKPYRLYIDYVKKIAHPEARMLDLCCGTGEFSFELAELPSKSLLCIDFSQESIACAKEKLSHTDLKHIQFEVGDVERLYLEPQSVDMICMAGSLSYLNLDILLKNVCHWLKPEGSFIVVDTYGHNPIFNFKRFLNYIFKFTTKQTRLGIPTQATVEKIRSYFHEFDIQYSGIFAFIGPFLRPLIGETLAAKAVDTLDTLFPFLKHWAFKITFCAKKPKRPL